jgi:hypothetical protein
MGYANKSGMELVLILVFNKRIGYFSKKKKSFLFLTLIYFSNCFLFLEMKILTFYVGVTICKFVRKLIMF